MNVVMINGCDGGVIVNWKNTPYIVTCQHCIEDDEHANVLYDDGTIKQSKCIYTDTKNDIAILTSNDYTYKGAPLADEYKRTSVTMVHHYPMPFSQVSGLTYRYYKHTCDTYQGSSGSPLFDKKGRVLGIHESYDDETHERYLVDCELIDNAFMDMTVS